MSERATGVHSTTVDPPNLPRGRTSASLSSTPLPLVSPASSQGIICDALSHLKSGAASAPLTSVFSKRVTVGAASKPLPGRTCLRVLRNSELSSFVWWPNWLQGNPRMASLSPYLSARAFIAVKSSVVVPHREATFRMSVGLPFRSPSDMVLPSIVVPEKSCMLLIATLVRATVDAARPSVRPLAEAASSAQETRKSICGVGVAVPREGRRAR
mmetsp:Transcript_27573/g.82348  ORF Transcript_27573/g.82348 Transcript_27573/m.82348 type:complete len:213 (-) Transcript_27573:1-639(-)